ncbi:hypothetical protein COCNU_03G002900 [Cocos nucifera]|uniref:THIF-type NAD/FAD binding fold domain-containing protein n=1 Tax=Cocos nucifera TaxID=13894 RepID=A0A8K0I274_COCNU|nr:hypothetical protein COCNU_03G002900 [Cocos nucifera]
MAERSKQWLLVGTGAFFGSLSTVALIRLFSRWAGKRQVKGLLTGCSVIVDPGSKEKLFGRCETRYNGVPDGLVYSNLLKDEVVSEQLTRNIQFFGMESQQNVTKSYVVVIGLGGVGSHAASMLLRSGVGRLLLVDFDQEHSNKSALKTSTSYIWNSGCLIMKCFRSLVAYIGVKGVRGLIRFSLDLK